MKVLRALKREPLHGYALARHIKRTSNDLLRIEQRALYPAKPPEHDGRCKSSLRKRLRSVISCLWSFNNGLLEIGYRGSEQKKTKLEIVCFRPITDHRFALFVGLQI